MNDVYSLLIAVGLGALVGLERKFHDNSAGIHTHALVSLGAALFVLLGAKVAGVNETARATSQVIMGIGFLGAAVVMRDGLQVRGLNTAVTIWCSSAIGAIAGAGFGILAAQGATIIVAANFILHLVEHKSGWFKLPKGLHRTANNQITEQPQSRS